MKLQEVYVNKLRSPIKLINKTSRELFVNNRKTTRYQHKFILMYANKSFCQEL